MVRRFVVLFILLAILATLFFSELFSSTGADPSVADWAENPSAVVVTWYLVNGDRQDIYEDEIHAILEDARGWQLAGVDFVEVDNRFDADIVIFMYDPKSQAPCGNNEWLYACAQGSALQFRTYCAVYLPNVAVTQVFTMFVNHEIGHCLDFGHRGNGLMRPSFQSDRTGVVVDGPLWPTPIEIDILRKRLK